MVQGFRSLCERETIKGREKVDETHVKACKTTCAATFLEVLVICLLIRTPVG